MVENFSTQYPFSLGEDLDEYKIKRRRQSMLIGQVSIRPKLQRIQDSLNQTQFQLDNKQQNH